MQESYMGIQLFLIQSQMPYINSIRGTNKPENHMNYNILVILFDGTNVLEHTWNKEGST